MLAFAAAWLLGIGLRGLPFSWVLACLGVLLGGGMFALGRLLRRPERLRGAVAPGYYPQLTATLVLIPLVFVAGWLRGSSYDRGIAQEREPYLALYEEGESKVIVRGTVTELTKKTETVVLRLSDCRIAGYQRMEERDAADCYVYVDPEDGADYAVGDVLRVYGSFRFYREASNPGQFDAYRYYAGKRVYAAVYAVTVQKQSEGAGGEAPPRALVRALTRARSRLTESLYGVFSREKAGVLSAMLLGERGLLEEETKELYQKNGISHILAISGLHVSLLCMGFYRLLRRLRLPRSLCLACGALAVLLFVVFTGGSTSSWRAAVMCLILLASTLLRRSYDLLSALAFAAIGITAGNPWELESAGFLLSFAAVGGVAVAQEFSEQVPRPLQALWFGVCIQCATVPVSLYFYYEVSPYAVLLNLIVVPLVSVLLLGGFAAALLGLFCLPAALFAAGGVHLLLAFYEAAGTLVQKLPYSFVLVGRPGLQRIAGYYCLLGVVLIVWKTAPLRRAAWKTALLRRAAPLLFLAAWCVLLIPARRGLSLTFLDVSQGDGIVLTTQQGAVFLVDCGSSDVGQVAEYRLAPFLKRQGVGVIDAAVVTHLDSDHYSGIKEILEAMQPYQGKSSYRRGYDGSLAIAVLVLPDVTEHSEAYRELEELAREKQVTVRYLLAGQSLSTGDEDVRLDCVSPERAAASENETSLVLWLRTPWFAAWLMGDAGLEAEAKLMRTAFAAGGKAPLILKVGHHGSRTASGEEFLAALAPDIAVISCGFRNRYGHPHEEVLWRLAESGARIYQTQWSGAITFRVAGGGLRLERYLEESAE